MTDREVKANIGVELDETSFVRTKAKLNAEFDKIKANMAKAMGAQGLAIDDKYIKQFTREFMAAKDKETQAAKRANDEQTKAAKRAIDDQIRDEKRKSAQIEALDEKRARIQEQGAGLFGGYRGMRAMRMFDEAKDLSKAQGGGGGNIDALGLIASINAPIAALALGGKMLAGVFDDLRDRAQQASSALFEIGGAKDLHQ